MEYITKQRKVKAFKVEGAGLIIKPDRGNPINVPVGTWLVVDEGKYFMYTQEAFDKRFETASHTAPEEPKKSKK